MVGGGGNSAGHVGDGRSGDGERKFCMRVGGGWS